MSAASEHESRDGLLRRMVEEFYARVYGFAFRLTGSKADAEDVTQQTFLQAQRKLDQLRDPASAQSWLFTIARNVFLKTRKKADRHGDVSLESVAEPSADELAADFDEEALQRALGELPDEYRAVLVSYYFHELSYKDIAETLEIPMGTVMSRLSRAKASLRRTLATEGAVTAGRAGESEFPVEAEEESS